MKDSKIRLQKHLSECGVASRRKAEELIMAGKVKVNGHVATIGTKVDPKRDKVVVRGKTVVAVRQKVYIMLHKPRGYVTTVNDEFNRKTVMDLVKDVGVRVFPVGRLDMDSEGLLFLTNDGEFANRLTHPSRHVTKTYRVTVDGAVDDEMLDKLCTGIDLDGKMTLPCDVFVVERRETRTVLNFIISEGRNRQIRRMCEAVGLKVLRLKRLEIAGVKMGMLPQGKWRPLNEREMTRLNAISESKRNGADV
ncbi:MAG: rRNA pseudouridine synthase [Clostridia bacterium]|nr:rRNA pseudouridine synthase [Clostridia bacterium]